MEQEKTKIIIPTDIENETQDKLLNQPIEDIFARYHQAQKYLDDMFNQDTDQGTRSIKYKGEQKADIRKQAIEDKEKIENHLKSKGCVIQRGNLVSGPDDIMQAWQKSLEA